MAFLLLIPVGELLVDAAIIAGGALLRAAAANAVPAAIGIGTAAVIVKATESSTPATNTTTVVGNGKLNCGDNGDYGDMLKKSGDNAFDRDHVPSKAALKEAARDIIKNNPKLELQVTEAIADTLFGTKSKPGLIAEKGQAIAIPKKDHQMHSDSYGKRNSPEKINTDKGDLQKAAKSDTKSIEEAEGKEMDPECLEKYKKAAKKIGDKTHAEYIKELTDLIKETIKNAK